MKLITIIAGWAGAAVVLAAFAGCEANTGAEKAEQNTPRPDNAELARMLELAKTQPDDKHMVLIDAAQDLGSSLYSNLPRVLSGEAKTKTILVQVQPNEHFVAGKTSPQVSGSLVVNGQEIRLQKLADGVLFGAGYAPKPADLQSFNYHITYETRDADGKRGHFVDIDTKPRK